MKQLNISKFGWLFILVAIITAVSVWFLRAARAPETGMVIVIGIDGMSVPGLQKAGTPHMDELIRNGAISLTTRSVMPTVSGPNWASHLLGAGPEQHGVTFNGWTRDQHYISPVATDEDGFFPSVFNAVRQQMPSAKTGFFYDWDVLIDVFNQSVIDTVAFADFYTHSFASATPWIIRNKPALTFIYIGNPDEVGHEHGWESDEYIRSLEDVDEQIGKLLSSLKEAGLFEKTHFLVLSDHGGIGHGHGGVSMQEISVPWIISGPGIIRDRMLEQPNDVANTAPTILKLLGLKQPYVWTSRPAEGAFVHSPLSSSNLRRYVPKPFSTFKGGLSDRDVMLDFLISDESLDIRYTTDEREPVAGDPIWEGPVLLKSGITIKAAAFSGNERSQTETVSYTRVKQIAQINLKNQPSPQYSAHGPKTLIDLEKASSGFSDGKWLGFRKDDFEAVIEFPSTEVAERVSVGILLAASSWIFEPLQIGLYGSVDGQRWTELSHLDEATIKSMAKAGRNDLILEFEKTNVKYLKITAQNTGLCPEGHPGQGQPAWLFIDEITVQ
jgi:hypothetical protein